MTETALKSILLNHFRSYKKQHFTFSPRGNIFTGANGSGKTNILEAISLFSPGRGLRRSKNYEISRNPENIGWKVKGVFERFKQRFEIDIGCKERGEKTIFLDGKKIKQLQMNEIFKILWVTPQMDRLWSSGASERRNFIDRISYGFFSNHAKALSSYEKLIRERGELLRNGTLKSSWMDALEMQMVIFGIEIFRNRSETIKILNASKSTQKSFPAPRLEILGEEFYEKDSFLRKLRDSRRFDSFSGRASVGPNKSDLNLVYVDKKIDAKHCSTGEQKALLVSIILAISSEITKQSGVPPILLLDEIGAHLDSERRNELMLQLFELKVQFFITATEKGYFREDYEEINQIATFCKDGNSYIN